MPFKSQAQRAWAHTPEGTKALGGPAAVKEWDSDTPSQLPKHVGDKPMKHSMAASALAHSSKKPAMKKHLKEMHIKEAHTGGYIVHKHSGKMEPPTEHVASDLDHVHDMMEEHMGQPNDGEEMAEGGGGSPAEEAAEGE